VELCQPGDDHTRETVRSRDAFLQAVDDTGNLGHPRQAGESARNHENDDGVGGDINASVAGCAGVITDEGDFITPFAAVDDQINNHRGDQPEQDTNMQGHPRKCGHLCGIVRQARQPRHFGESLGHLEAGFAPFSKDPVVIPQNRDVVEHQSNDDLVYIQLGFQDTGDQGVQRAAKHT